MKKLAKYQQVYRPIYSDILAGFSVISFNLLDEDGSKKYYIKHLKETDYGSLEFLVESYEHEARARGLITEEEQLESLNHMNVWTTKDETELVELRNEIKNLNVQISSAYVKSQRAPLEKILEKKKKELELLAPQRDELFTITIDSYVEKKKNEEILRLSFFDDQEFKNLSFSEDDYGELTHNEYADLVMSFNKKIEMFSDHHLSKLALLPFFINSIFLCKSNPFIFYGKPVVDLTVHQSELFSKGMFYKSVLEQGHKPPDSFYDDLDKLVNWYEIKGKSKSGPQNPNGGIHMDGNIKKVSDMEGQGVSYVGATKEEMQDIAKQQGLGTRDLATEAEKLKKELGKDTLSIEDMARLHGL